MNQLESNYGLVTRSAEYAPNDAEQPGEQSAPNPLLIVHSLLRGRYIVTVLLAMILGAGGAIAGYFATKPTYQSRGWMRVEPLRSGGLSADEKSIPMLDTWIATQLMYIRDEHLIREAMARGEWQAVRRGLSSDDVAEFRQNLSAISPKGSAALQITYTDEKPAVALEAVKSVIATYMRLHGRDESGDLLVRLRHAEELVRRDKESLKQVDNEIARKVKLADDADPVVLERMYFHQVDETQKLLSELNAVRRLLAATEGPTTAGAAKTVGPAGAGEEMLGGVPVDKEPIQIAQTDRWMQQLLTEKRNAERDLALVSKRFGKQHRSVVDAKGRLDIINRDIETYVADYNSRAKEQAASARPGEFYAASEGDLMLHSLRVKEANLRALYEEGRGKTKSLAEQHGQIRTLQGGRDALKQNIAATEKLIEDLRFRASVGGRVTVGNAGETPQVFKDNRLKLAFGGAFGGAGFAVALMLGIGFLNRRLVSVHDARLGLHKVDRVLGLLPQVPDNLADGEEAAVAAHCVHHIRTLLQLEPGLPSRRVYAVTSPSPGDGKTTLSIALGMSFAASGAKTLLLDCDIIGGGLSSKMDQMIRPKIGRVLRREGLITDEQLQQALTIVNNTGRHVGDVLVDLGFASDADVAHAAAVQAQSYVGLLDVLGGESLADCVTGTGRPGLFVLPIGSADPHHAAHLSPVALHRVLAEARAAFDVVLVDTGPILGSLEAAMVAAQADASVLTVSRGVPQALVKRALDRLVEVGANIAGMVLNRAASREVADFAFSSGSARSTNRRLPAPDAVPGNVQIRLGTVGQAMDSSTRKSRR